MNVAGTAGRLLMLLLLFPTVGVTQSQAPRFPGEVEQVTVDVVVLDKDGEPVRGLKASDFTLYEDGKAQPSVSFEAIEAPEAPAAPEPSALVRRRVSTNQAPPGPERSFVLVFDDVHLSTTQAERAKKSVAGKRSLMRVWCRSSRSHMTNTRSDHSSSSRVRGVLAKGAVPADRTS